MQDQQDAGLHLIVPLDVPLSQVLTAGDHFLRLVQSVAGEVLQTPSLVTWVFDGFSAGSLDLHVRPEPKTADLAPAMPVVTHAVAAGIRELETRPSRPAYFNDAALQHAKDLARLEGVMIRNGNVGSPMTGTLRQNVDLIIGSEQEEWGTIEGRIESLTVHRVRSFNLYEPITGERIECSFGYRIPVEQIGLAVERRSAVSGRMVYRGDRIVRMAAEEIEIFPGPDELPTADEVFGILAD